MIQNDFRMCPGKVATFQCGECSFPSDAKNNHNVQFLFFVLHSISPSQLFAATAELKPNSNEINCPYIPFHHECF